MKAWVIKKALKHLGRSIVKQVRKKNKKQPGRLRARDNPDFIFEKETRKRMASYYQATCREIDEKGLDVPRPDAILFGHTHVPIPGADGATPPTLQVKLPRERKREVELLNCGGWIIAADGNFKQANVFIYESGKGLTRRHVS